MVALKLMEVGGSLGVVLPEEVQARLKVGKGDLVYLTESPDGYRLTPSPAETGTQMGAARAIMEKRRNALRVLAR